MICTFKKKKTKRQKTADAKQIFHSQSTTKTKSKRLTKKEKRERKLKENQLLNNL